MSRRVAVVAGLRTPFARSGTAFKDVSPLELATGVVTELVVRANLPRDEVDLVVYGAVVPDLKGPNVAREVVLAGNFPRRVDAFSVSRACATGTQAVVSAARSILSGEADVAIAGGVDSLSRPPVTYQPEAIDVLMEARAAKSLSARLKALAKLRPRDLAPEPPALEEYSTGLTMGQAAEKMARENGISRADQDAYALESHRKAVEAWEKGVFDDEVMPFPIGPDYTQTIERDTIPRADTSLDKLASLKPVFDRRYGTVTAGNSSPLTDGAAAVLLMEAGAAERLGLHPKAFIRSWGFAALDPGWQLLMGPAFATPVALERAGLSLADIDVVDMHEAFAAQMLSNLQAFASAEWAEQHLGRDEAIGAIPEDRLNLYGGSISLGHPFAATGARQITTMANELERRDAGTALVTQCAAGGLGAALILER